MVDGSSGSQPQRHPSPSLIRLPSSSDSASSSRESDTHTHDVHDASSVPPNQVPDVEHGDRGPSDASRNTLLEDNRPTEPLTPSVSARNAEGSLSRHPSLGDTTPEGHPSTEPPTLPTIDGHTENDFSGDLQGDQHTEPSSLSTPVGDNNDGVSAAAPLLGDPPPEETGFTMFIPLAVPNPGPLLPGPLPPSINPSRSRGDSVPDAGSTRRCFACSRRSPQLVTPCTCSEPQPETSPRRHSNVPSTSTSSQSAASVSTVGEARTFLRGLSAPRFHEAEPVVAGSSPIVGHQDPGPSSVTAEPRIWDPLVGDQGPTSANAATEDGPRLGHSAQPSSSTNISTTPGGSTNPSTAWNTTRNSLLTPPTAPTSPTNPSRDGDKLECGCMVNGTSIEHGFCQIHNPHAEQNLQSRLENLESSAQGSESSSDTDARARPSHFGRLENGQRIVLAPRRHAPVVSGESDVYTNNVDHHQISPPPGFDESMRGRHLANQELLHPTPDASPARSGDLAPSRSWATGRTQQDFQAARPSTESREAPSLSSPPTYRSRYSTSPLSRHISRQEEDISESARQEEQISEPTHQEQQISESTHHEQQISESTHQEQQNPGPARPEQQVPGSSHPSMDVPEYAPPPPPTYNEVMRQMRAPAYLRNEPGLVRRHFPRIADWERPQTNCEGRCRNCNYGCSCCGWIVDNVAQTCVTM